MADDHDSKEEEEEEEWQWHINLNDLPDKTLIHIISFLPTTRTRIRTSLISKRWRHLYLSVPSIDLPDYDYPLLIMDRILSLYPHPTLTRLAVSARPANNNLHTRCSNDHLRNIRNTPLPHLDRWIRFAASRSVTEIELNFHHPFPYSFNHPRIPQSLVQLCSQTLTSLRLSCLCFPKLPGDFLGFPFLKTLVLRLVLFANSDALSQLLCSSFLPSLEYLVIDKSRWVPNVTPTSPTTTFPNLLKLKFVDCVDPELENRNIAEPPNVRCYTSPQNFNMEAPNLRYLYFSGAIECFHLTNYCPRLRGAHINCSGAGALSCRRVVDIAKVLSNVEVLVVGSWFFPHSQFCDDRPPCIGYNYSLPLFENLKEFHCHGYLPSFDNLPCYLFFLCKCRSLEKLCINLDFYKPGFAEVNDANKREIGWYGKNEQQILDHYDFLSRWYDQDQEFWNVKVDAINRIAEEKELLYYRKDTLPTLKVVSVTQLSNYPTYMRMHKFILEKSPALELLQVNFIQQQQQHVELEQLYEQFSCIPHASPFVKIQITETEASDYDSRCRGKCSPLNHLWSTH